MSYGLSLCDTLPGALLAIEILLAFQFFTPIKVFSKLAIMESQKTGWKVRGRGAAAELLDLHHSTLFFRMRKSGIQRPSEFSRRSHKKAVQEK
jgi:hypothetical protein